MSMWFAARNLDDLVDNFPGDNWPDAYTPEEQAEIARFKKALAKLKREYDENELSIWRVHNAAMQFIELHKAATLHGDGDEPPVDAYGDEEWIRARVDESNRRSVNNPLSVRFIVRKRGVGSPIPNAPDEAERIIRIEMAEGLTSWGRPAVGTLLAALDTVRAERTVTQMAYADIVAKLPEIWAALTKYKDDDVEVATARNLLLTHMHKPAVTPGAAS